MAQSGWAGPTRYTLLPGKGSGGFGQWLAGLVGTARQIRVAGEAVFVERGLVQHVACPQQAGTGVDRAQGVQAVSGGHVVGLHHRITTDVHSKPNTVTDRGWPKERQ